MRNMQAFSDVVVLAIKAALAPVQERLSASEQTNRELQARITELSGLRDRVTTIETKSAQPVTAVDLSPMLERVAAVEARIDTLGDVRDRIVTIETKSAAPVSAVALEAVTSGPSASDVELSIRNQVDPLAKELATVRERLVAVEVRQPIPGPAGEKGADGINGTNGRDGVDGLGADDLIAEQTDDRSIVLKYQRGERVKEMGRVVIPAQIARGVYVDGKTYDRGDLVTWGGSQWHCDKETNARPGEGNKDWTLVVKRGRDGRDGKDAPVAAVVKL